jgi:hypothetical protein
MSPRIQKLREHDAGDERDADDHERIRLDCPRSPTSCLSHARAREDFFGDLIRTCAHRCNRTSEPRAGNPAFLHRSSMSAMGLTGGCLCGAVRYSVSEPFEIAGYCHCTRCQRRTGAAASANARTVPGSLTVEQGEELVTVFEPDDDESWPKAFCSRCGSALWSHAPDDPRVHSVRLGTLDDDPGIEMSFRQFVAYAVSWEEIPDDGLVHFDERVDRSKL